MIKKIEIKLPSSYLLKIIGAYEDKGHETVSLDNIKETIRQLNKNGLHIYSSNNLGMLLLERGLNMHNSELYYLTCYNSHYSLTDSGKKFLEENVIPAEEYIIVDGESPRSTGFSQRRIFYDTIDKIPFKS